jgi:hypothetical protein
MNAKNFVNAYIKWLRQNTRGTEVGSVCAITVPFLDSHCDHLQIYIEESGGGFVFTDAGNTIGGLALQGYDRSAVKNSEVFQSILSAFGLKLAGDALVVEATHEDCGIKMHRLIQAMLLISWLCLQCEKEGAKAAANEKTLDDLASEQGVNAVKDVDKIEGTWPGEAQDGFEEFVEELRYGK